MVLTLKDKLSRLTYGRACKLLGPDGRSLIREGGKYEIDIEEQVFLNNDLFRLTLDEAVASIVLDDGARQRLHFSCSRCAAACEHVGAAFSLILEEKVALGLAAPPRERKPIESLDEEELVQRAIAEREERARTERMVLRSMDSDKLWTDYTVTNSISGKTYRVALRGWNRGESYCSCPDFRKNTLGTCKHILNALAKVQRRFNAEVRRTPWRPDGYCVYLQYGKELQLRLMTPEPLDGKAASVVRPLVNRHIEDIHALLGCMQKLNRLGHEVTVYPDAEEYIDQRLRAERVQKTVAEIRKDPANHPLRKTLLNAELLPYQLDGIAFAVGAGRAVLADDMGLGKTIQAIGAAELLAREAGISRVLVICPASLKSQWRSEIHRFCGRDCQLVLGRADERARQYDNPCFFTICNYEQVLRDIVSIEPAKWDLIILDEGQRIKNWEAKTTRTVKALKSPYALVLSGTPLENRLDDIFSVVEFIDERRLGPAFRFYNIHRVVDERGKVLGYKNLDVLRRRLAPMLLRRTRAAVMAELPPRTTEIVRITPTDEQIAIHNSHRRIVSSIVRKQYITEMDLLRLQKALLMCRMAANSTFLVNKEPPGYSSKLDELEQLLERLAQEHDRKVLLFSEWTTMLNLIEPFLEQRDLTYVRLDGSVPQKNRAALVHRFRKDPQCPFFITTNAGATGLNLQAANTVVNVDLPWNPAILEQRISRAHRMGQKRPLQVFLLVSEGTLEESLLGTLSAKHQLALAVLDPGADVSQVDLASSMEELRRRLEVLLGARPDAGLDESEKQRVEAQARTLARKDKIATAGGQLLGAAFEFLGEMLPPREETPESRQLGEALRQRLAECLDRDESGRPRMTVTFPDESAVDRLAESLARVLAVRT